MVDDSRIEMDREKILERRRFGMDEEEERVLIS
jgi:hypothetical protein